MRSCRILQKNLRALAKKQPELAREIERADSPAYWHVFNARNGMPTLEIDHEGKTLSVHSRYDPKKEAEKWTERVEGEWERLILFGIGLGYHLEVLRKKYPEEKVTLVENNLGHLYQTLSSRDLVPILDWLDEIIVQPNPADAATSIFNLVAGKIREIKLESLPAYERIYPQYWQVLHQGLRDSLLTYSTNFATSLRFKYQWMLNLRENLIPYLEAPDVGELFGEFEGVPIILVAAGPSLDKNIHLLADLKDKALILAAGSAIGPLLHHGILPDLVVSIDPGDANYKHFEGIKAETIPLVFPSTINHQIIKNYPGPSLSFGLDFYRTLDLDFEKVVEREKTMLISGPTIAITTLDLAMKLGGNPIILIGQDLAYADGISHAVGNVGRKMVQEKDLIETEGIHGTVFTTYVFLSMKVQIEKVIAGFDSMKKVIDATEGGALIKGTKIDTLKETIKKYCQEDYPIQEKLNYALAQKQFLSNDQQSNLIAEIEEILQDFKVFYDSLAAIDDLATKMADRLKRGILKPNGYERTNKQMIKAYNRYQRTKLFRNYISHIQREELEFATGHAREKVDLSATFEEKVQNTIEGYQKFFKGSLPFIQALEQSIFMPLLNDLRQK